MESKRSLRDRARSALAHPRAPLAWALLAVLLTLPALGAGLIADDYFHRLVLLDIGFWGSSTEPIADLFAFVPDSLREHMIEVGYLPWWSDPEIHVALARPLTAATHVLDIELWPDAIWLQHAHSLLWFGVGVGLVAWLYRRVHAAGAAMAGLAGLLFAVEDAHAMAAGWIANRNGILCLVGGTAVLLLHHAWRVHRRPLCGLLAVVALAVGLGFGEATVGAVAYLAAWQLVVDRGSLVRRMLPLLPYLLVVAAWRLVYDATGYGIVGSSLYIDPGNQPALFLSVLPERWPLLVAAQWWQLPVDLWLMLSRPGQLVMAAVAAALSIAVLILLWQLLRARPLARFWALGMALSAVPLCAAFPMDRLLLFTGLGAFPLLAMTAESVSAWPLAATGGPRWRRRVVTVLLCIHGPLAACMLVGRVAALPLFAEFFSAAARTAPDGPAAREQTFVFVNGNDFPVVYLSVIRTVEGGDPPRRIAQLASITAENRVLRESTDTLLISPRDGFLSHSLDRLLASPDHAFVRGQRIERSDYTAEIRSLTEDRRPAEVAFRFRQPLESPQYRWLYWRDGRLREFPLPAIGEGLTVPVNYLFE
jgi:hypothetical protein